MADASAMTEEPLLDLAAATERAEAHAQKVGALTPLQTESTTTLDQGVTFSLEWMSTLTLKDFAKLLHTGDNPKVFNPFLPYEKDLYVADISDTHVSILNKFPISPRHILFITRTFVDQEAPWEAGDVDATVKALRAIDGLFFYNSGRAAGASQPHRHLQIIPGREAPIAALFPTDGPTQALRRTDAIPFAHLFCRFDAGLFDQPARARSEIARLINAAYDEAGLRKPDGTLRPYNVVMTRRWMLIVPRRQEAAEGINLHALSYAGLIVLRQREHAETARAYGPMRLLVEAAG